MPQQAVYVYQDHQVEFCGNSAATMFYVMVDGLVVAQVRRSKRIPHGTVWRCQMCQQPLRGKRYVIKHVVSNVDGAGR